MSQSLMIHGAVKVEQSRHEFPPNESYDGFFKVEFLVTDNSGNETTITILSATELRVDGQS